MTFWACQYSDRSHQWSEESVLASSTEAHIIPKRRVVFCSNAFPSTMFGASTSLTNSSREHSLHRKGATLLNNIGCSLLKQGAYADALQTFHDAVLVMSEVCSANSKQAFDNPRSSTRLGEHLQAAKQRLRSPKPCQVLIVQSGLDYDAVTPPFCILELEDYRYLEIDERAFHHPYHTFVSPVRVEKDCCSCTGHVRFDSHLESAALIYNLGLSYAFLSKCQEDTQVERYLENAATRLYGMANSILHHCQESGDKAHKEDCVFYDNAEHIVLIRLAVLHSWHQLIVQREHENVLADHTTGNQIFDCLVDLQETIWWLHNYEKYSLVAKAPAAAA